MNLEQINEIEKILDEEIKTYCEIEEYTINKKDILVKGDIDSLVNLDQKILVFNDEVKKLEIKRRSLNKRLGNETITLKEIIEKTREVNIPKANSINEKREKIRTTIENIENYNIINAELIKHSLKLIEGSVSMIAKAVNPEMISYSNCGQLSNKEYSNRSSIVTQA